MIYRTIVSLVFGSLLFCDSLLACTTTADCPANAKYCNDFFICEDCCDFDSNTCPSDCSPDAGSGECRNSVGVACVATVPEFPEKSHSWILIGSELALAGLVIALFTKGFTA